MKETIATRLATVRAAMREERIDALVVPHADEYLGEYLPERNQRLRWLSGFDGSAGLAIVLADAAAIFVDGRYTVQVRQQVPSELFEYHHLLDEPPVAWLAERLPSRACVGYDPRLHTAAWRSANPGAEGNIRDHATLEQLVVLSNLEGINAMLIHQGHQAPQRLAQLNAMAITQMRSLLNAPALKRLASSQAPREPRTKPKKP